MALVKTLKRISLERDAPHLEVDCTFSIIDAEGERFLQIDTYGSSRRRIRGKKSQSIRFGPTAVRALRQIIKSEFD